MRRVPKIVELKCCECGRRYRGRRDRLAVCSDKCRRKRRRKLRPQTFKRCEQCRELFRPVDRLNVKFCSWECSTENKNGRPSIWKGKRRPSLDRARIGTCLTCGDEFRATGDFKDRRQIYCSHRCYLVNRRVSHFENDVFLFLAMRGVVCDRGVRAGKWTFDGQVVGTNILIEADGSYWHSLPEIVERDQRKDAWCPSNGYFLVRIAEEAFAANPEAACVAVLAPREAQPAPVAAEGEETGNLAAPTPL